MATLKGQNLRILTYDSTAEDYKTVALATSCTVNLNTNTDEATTKDDVGMSSKPEVTLKSWQMSVESLNVADVGAMINAMKKGWQFTLLFEETDTRNNQDPAEQPVVQSYTGQAYLTDLTVNFDNRTNSAKSLQFTGISELEQIETLQEQRTATVASFTKGQYVRMFLSSDNTTTPVKVLAAPVSLSVHFSVSLEDCTTKDTTGDWQVQEPTGISYDISTSALVYTDETITSSVQAMTYDDLFTIYKNSTPVKWLIANVSGANNRTKGAVILSGSVILASLTVNSANRQAVKYDATFNSWGPFSIGS